MWRHCEQRFLGDDEVGHPPAHCGEAEALARGDWCRSRIREGAIEPEANCRPKHSHFAVAMPPRFFVDLPLATSTVLTLPAGASRHAQVLRLQPGDAVTLFDGRGGEWQAEIAQMGRKEVVATVGMHCEIDPELALSVTLAVGMPANERMDDLVEKATELGVACIQPLMCELNASGITGRRWPFRPASKAAARACPSSSRCAPSLPGCVICPRAGRNGCC